jgi:hypothetical protein
MQVDADPPISVATVHRWRGTILRVNVPEPFALFPVVTPPSGIHGSCGRNALTYLADHPNADGCA